MIQAHTPTHWLAICLKLKTYNNIQALFICFSVKLTEKNNVNIEQLPFDLFQQPLIAIHQI